MPQSRYFFVRFVRRIKLSFLLPLLLVVFGVAWWLNHSLSFSTKQDAVEVTIVSGASAFDAIQAVADSGLGISPSLFGFVLRVSGQADQIKAGRYRFVAPVSNWDVMSALLQGKQKSLTVRFLEGATWAQIRATLAQNPDLEQLSKDWSDAEVMKALGRSGEATEGRFFPDTYHFQTGASDLEILRQALARMDDKLTQVWTQRQSNLPYRSPYQVLTMASIIEKETGQDDERALVAAVFVNRLRKGMRLQTDPTVIYGLGSSFNGNLKRSHLETDNPYNSYTRSGLPPTPISAPSMASLLAAAQPTKSKMLYFVGRGDGTSHFSATLTEHNRAVRKYQLEQTQ